MPRCLENSIGRLRRGFIYPHFDSSASIASAAGSLRNRFEARLIRWTGSRIQSRTWFSGRKLRFLDTLLETATLANGGPVVRRVREAKSRSEKEICEKTASKMVGLGVWRRKQG